MKSSQEKIMSRRYRIGQILHHWGFKIFEVIAFILLFSKLIPEKWLQVAKDTGWALFILLGTSVLVLLIINFLLTFGYAKEIAKREIEFSEKIGGLQADFNQKFSDLKSENAVLEKKARYADIIPMLTVAFQNLHNAVRKDHDDKTKYHESFTICCENLEKAFTKITGVDCHVCIKMTVFPSNQIPSYKKLEKATDNIKVRTYCRSSSYSSSRSQIDQRDIVHLIVENSDFESIFKNKGDCFFCNDLAQIEEYKNSSLKHKHGSCIYFPKGTPIEQKVSDWQLEYRATIVAPIRPIIKETKEEHTILGLLCVDSKVPDVFNTEQDSPIMIGCADGIYNSFKKLFSPVKTSVNK